VQPVASVSHGILPPSLFTVLIVGECIVERRPLVALPGLSIFPDPASSFCEALSSTNFQSTLLPSLKQGRKIALEASRARNWLEPGFCFTSAFNIETMDASTQLVSRNSATLRHVLPTTPRINLLFTLPQQSKSARILFRSRAAWKQLYDQLSRALA
jgi:hypothetical protein